jgi:hypothetical protein
MNNDLKCPKCDCAVGELFLASYPAQYEGSCKRCDFEIRFFNREDSFLPITQDEINNFYNKNIVK